METFGQRFTRLRKEKKLTQEEISIKVNVSAQAVSKWENDISMPDISILNDLADILGVSTDELLGRRSNQIISLEQEQDITKKILRIKIVSSEGDKITINLPIPLIKACIDTGMKISDINGNEQLENIDLSQIYSLIEQGVIGEIMDMESSKGDKIILVVE